MNVCDQGQSILSPQSLDSMSAENSPVRLINLFEKENTYIAQNR